MAMKRATRAKGELIVSFRVRNTGRVRGMDVPQVYVGGAGWVGIELPRVSDKELAAHLLEAWKLIAPEKLHSLLQEK